MDNRVNRIDIGVLGSVKITPQGFLKIPASATRAGIFLYRSPNGSVIREFRPPEEVFKKESIDSISGIPITYGHPPKMLDSKNTKEFQVGFTDSNVKREDNKINLTATITDDSIIGLLKNSKIRETSCGYSCRVEKTPGEYNGQKYDSIQRDIIYNHLAIVEKGRAGPEVRLHMDSDDGLMIDEEKKEDKDLENKEFETETKGDSQMSNMTKIKIDGVEYEVANELAQSLREKKFDKLNEDLSESNKKVSELTGKIDALNAEIKKKDEEIEKFKSQKLSNKEIISIARDRIALEDFAKTKLGNKFDESKIQEMSDVDLKKEIIKNSYPDQKIDEKDESYIHGAFSVLKEQFKNDEYDANKKLKQDIADKSQNRNNIYDADEARRKSMQRSMDAWKTGTDNK